MSGKVTSYYSDTLIDLFEKAYSAVKILSNAISVGTFEKGCESTANIQADVSKLITELRAKLTTEFLAPIERDDILLLAHLADGLIRSYCHTCNLLYVYDIKKAEELFSLSNQCKTLAETTLQVIKEFCGKKKTWDSLFAIEAEKIAFDAAFKTKLKKLYSGVQNTLTLFVKTDVMNSMKTSCDICYDISQNVSRIILRNS